MGDLCTMKEYFIDALCVMREDILNDLCNVTQDISDALSINAEYTLDTSGSMSSY